MVVDARRGNQVLPGILGSAVAELNMVLDGALAPMLPALALVDVHLAGRFPEGVHDLDGHESGLARGLGLLLGRLVQVNAEVSELTLGLGQVFGIDLQ